MIAQRVEKHLIKQSNKYYQMFCDFTHKSKNLYNHANYLIRKEFTENNKWLRFGDIDKLLKKDLEFDDYRQMPTARSAQQTLRLLDKNWKAFFKILNIWTKNKEGYSGRPVPPKYKSKNGKSVLILTNQDVKLRNDLLIFPKVFNSFTIKPKFIENEKFISFQQVRIIPKNKLFEIELVYKIEVPDSCLPDNKRYLSIDLGLDNLATISNNIEIKPIIINGKGLKSMNKYYNKLISHYQKIAKQMNNSNYTNRLYKLISKRNRKIMDYLHKVSKYIIDYAISNNINTIVVGNNKNWKQNSKLSKKVNQSFVQIPHSRFIELLEYKAETVGIKIIRTEESYTSGTSFLDNEAPIKENYNKARRIYRGLFKSNNGTLINADINGALQILKKVFPNAYADGIEGVVLHPVRVDII